MNRDPWAQYETNNGGGFRYGAYIQQHQEQFYLQQQQQQHHQTEQQQQQHHDLNNFPPPHDSSDDSTASMACCFDPLEAEEEINLDEAAAAPSVASQPLTNNYFHLRGEHAHNDLDFLKHSCDDNGKPHCLGGNKRTLSICLRDLVIHFGGLTKMHLEFWALKQNYFNSIILIETGSHYCALHQDADTLNELLELNYQRGRIAKVIFHSNKLVSYTNKLVDHNQSVVLFQLCRQKNQIDETCQSYETRRDFQNAAVFLIDNHRYKSDKENQIRQQQQGN